MTNHYLQATLSFCYRDVTHAYVVVNIPHKTFALEEQMMCQIDSLRQLGPGNAFGSAEHSNS
jgi:hypothetical protein